MGGPFQPPIPDASPWCGCRLMTLTIFNSPARRKACGYLFLTPWRRGAKPPENMFRVFAFWRFLAEPKHCKGGCVEKYSQQSPFTTTGRNE